MPDNSPPQAAAPPQRWRMRVAVVLTVLFGLTLIMSNHAGWLATTILDTDSFVETLAPLPSDPAVSRALGESIGDSVILSNEVGQAIADKLPDGLKFAAVPLTQGLRDLIADIATEIIRSDVFTAIWEKTLELTHRATLLFIRGVESDLLTTEDGYAVLDLTDVGTLVIDRLDELGFDTLDGVELDLTIELFEARDRGIVQTLANLLYSVWWFSIVLTAALVVAAYAVATDRRKITVWAGGAAALAMLVSLIDGRLIRALVTGAAKDPIQEAGIAAAGNIIFSRFIVQSWIILGLGLLAATVAWLMGDSDRAQSVKAVFAGAHNKDTGEPDEPSSLAVFIASHRRPLEWGAVVLLGAFLLLGPVSPFIVVLVTLLALILYILAIEYVAASVPDDR